MSERHLVVVGGGITGLAAAWEASAHDGVRVTVLEASDRAGGKLRTSAMTLDDGTELRIDEGADAFLARVPDAVRLCHELGLGDELTQPAIGRAKVFSGGALKFLPEDTVLGVPTDMDALAASGILSEDGLLAARGELERTGPGPHGDVAIGTFLAEHYGSELVDRVVGPLIGGINAGDIDELSMDAVTPQLAAAAADGGSMTTALAARRPSAPEVGPVFHAVLGGSGRLVEALVEALLERGVELRLGAQLRQLRHDGDRWELIVGHRTDTEPPGSGTELLSDDANLLDDHTEMLDADAVVLATPAPDAATLLDPLCHAAATDLAAMTHSAVALATLVYRAEDVPTPMDASGFLVPRTEGLLLTAASWGSSKWAHWNDGRHVVLRVSAGRTGDERQMSMDDHQLLDALRSDLATTMGISEAPVATRIARWPLGFTQYTVGHLDRVDRIDAALAIDCPTIALAGAAYRGLGIPACIRQGREAARHLLLR